MKTRRPPIKNSPLDWLGRNESKENVNSSSPSRQMDTNQQSPTLPTSVSTASEDNRYEKEKLSPIIEPQAQDSQSGFTDNKSKTRDRVTYHVRFDLKDKVKDYAYWHRLSLYEVVDQALDEFFQRHSMKPIETNAGQ